MRLKLSIEASEMLKHKLFFFFAAAAAVDSESDVIQAIIAQDESDTAYFSPHIHTWFLLIVLYHSEVPGCRITVD